MHSKQSIESLMDNNSTFKSLMLAAGSLIEQGLSTPETAFIDAYKRHDILLTGIFNARAYVPENRDRTGSWNEVYDGIIDQMAIEVYKKIRANK